MFRNLGFQTSIKQSIESVYVVFFDTKVQLDQIEKKCQHASKAISLASKSLNPNKKPNKLVLMELNAGLRRVRQHAKRVRPSVPFHVKMAKWSGHLEMVAKNRVHVRIQEQIKV